MRSLVVLLAASAAVSASAPARSAEPHPFSVHDMLAMERISEPAASADGRRVAFTVRTTDLDANRGRTDVWIADVAGGGARRLTTDPANDSSPRFTPDGTAILFLSTRGGSSQVWSLPLAGGEARRVTGFPLDVTSFVVSPDGTRLVVSMDVFPDCDTLACTAERLAATEESPATGQPYDRLFVRHWDTWTDGRRSHLFAVTADGSGTPVDLMRAMDADCPSKPFGGAEEYTFAGPDAVVFAARDVGREEAWSTDFDLYRAPVDGSAPPANLTDDNPAWDTQPVYSPTGGLAYLAMRRPGYESDRFRVVLVRPDGSRRVLTEDWDRSPSGLAWSRDGKTLYAHADHLGNHALFAIDAETGRVRTIVERGTVRAVAPAGDRVVIALDHLRSPAELYAVEPGGGAPSRITDLNGERVAAAILGEPEPFTFAGWNGETVHGWIVKPVGFDPSRRWPVAFLIHGGPQGSFGNDFHYRWNPQAYAGAGYAAVMVDFHGSTGYGQEFTDSIRGDWGGKPLEDLQKGLAAALERYPWMDGERVCALGASYGGYMINWIAGAWPDRFRCLVNHDGNLDEVMAYFETEELWFPEWERGGTPWEVPEAYREHNPRHLVDRWKTPMLVIHGALDYRVVLTQGLATFTALQRQGIPSRLLVFPDENHWVLKPANSIQWHETVLGWLDRWLADEPAP